jgi:hypothetical protein
VFGAGFGTARAAGAHGGYAQHADENEGQAGRFRECDDTTAIARPGRFIGGRR